MARNDTHTQSQKNGVMVERPLIPPRENSSEAAHKAHPTSQLNMMKEMSKLLRDYDRIGHTGPNSEVAAEDCHQYARGIIG